jgi:anti-anti-sigma factor
MAAEPKPLPPLEEELDSLQVEISGWGSGPVIVRLLGELDIAGLDDLAAALAPRGDRTVIVDLSQLRFIDGVGLRALLARIDALGPRARVRGEVQRPVARVLQLTGMTSRLLDR